MRGIRILTIASAVGVVVLGAPTGAIEKCDLVAGYMLEYEEEPEFGVSIYRCTDIWRLELEKFRGRSASGEARW